MDEFAKNAQGFTKNPLGILGLFIVLIYGFATFAFSMKQSDDYALYALLFLLVTLPFTVLWTFYRLVTKHPALVYGPGDFDDQSAYVELVKLVLADRDSGSTSAASVDTQASRIASIRAANPSNFEKSVLWVDDKPEGNRIIAEAFRRLGFEVVIALSTEEAMNEITSRRAGEKRSFNSIISDMGRPPDAQAGYTLLKQLRDERVETPFYIYAGSSNPDHKALARSKGANGSTNNSAQLMRWIVTDAVSSSIWE